MLNEVYLSVNKRYTFLICVCTYTYICMSKYNMTIYSFGYCWLYSLETWMNIIHVICNNVPDKTLYEGCISYICIFTLLLLFTQSCLTLRPHGLQHVRLPCPSPSPRACSNSCPFSRWCHPTTSSSVVPFSSCLQSFPASGSFPMSQLFQSVGASASASVL